MRMPNHTNITAILIACFALALGACTKESSGAADDEAAGPTGTETRTEPPQTAAGAAVVKPDEASASAQGEGQVYGAGVGESETVAISELLADPKAFEGKTVRVEGTVTDVCPKRGCWFEMAGDEPGQKMRFKVRDGDMVFPMNAKGQHAVAEGVVFTQTLSLEQTREHLEYQKREYKADVDPENVTEPMTIVRLNGLGAELRDSR